MKTPSEEPFEKLSGKTQTGLLQEFLFFLKHNKKYWMAPIILTLLLIGLVIILAGSSAAPYIYTLF